MFCLWQNLEPVGLCLTGWLQCRVPAKSKILRDGMQIVKTILVKNRLVNLIVKPQ